MADDTRVGDDFAQPQLQVDLALKGTRTEGHGGTAKHSGELQSPFTNTWPCLTLHSGHHTSPHPSFDSSDQDGMWLPETMKGFSPARTLGSPLR